MPACNRISDDQALRALRRTAAQHLRTLVSVSGCEPSTLHSLGDFRAPPTVVPLSGAVLWYLRFPVFTLTGIRNAYSLSFASPLASMDSEEAGTTGSVKYDPKTLEGWADKPCY